MMAGAGGVISVSFAPSYCHACGNKAKPYNFFIREPCPLSTHSYIDTYINIYTHTQTINKQTNIHTYKNT